MQIRDQKKPYKENKKGSNLYSALIRLSSLALSQTDPDQIISQALKDIRKIFKAKLCWIFLVEDNKIKLKSLGDTKRMQNLGKSQLLPKLSPEILKHTYPIICNRWGELYKNNRVMYRFLSGRNIHKIMGVPLKKDGKLIGALNVARNYNSPDFIREDLKSLTLLGTMIVMTKLKRAEEESKESQDFLEAIIDNIPNPIFIKDRKHRWVVLNQALSDLVGYPREKMLGKSDYDFFPKEQADFFWKKDEQMFRTGKVVDIPEEPITDKEGKIHYLHTKKAPLRNSSGKITHLVGIIEDVTERKQAEEALRESESKYRDLTEKMIDIIYTLDTAGKVTSVNEAFKTVYGFNSDEVIGENFAKWILKEERPKAMAAFKQILRGEKITTETVLLDKEGKPHDVEFSSTPIIKAHKVVGTRGIIRDITERKRVEESLEQKVLELNSFINNIPDMAWLKDAESRFIVLNRAFGEVVSMNPETLIGQTCEACFGAKAGKKFREDDLKVMKGRKQVNLEEKILDSKGNELWLETIKSPIFDHSGKVVGTVGIARNVTERKQAEEKLKESEEKYKTLVETSNDMIFTVDLKGNFLFTNKAFEKNLGYSDEEIKRINGFELVHPEDLKIVKKQFTRLVEGKSVDNMEYRYKAKNGFYINILNNASPIFDSEGNIVAALGIARDITERKRAQKVLIRNERIARERARLLTDLRNLDRIDDNLTRVCQAVRDSGLFERAVMTLHKSGGGITHLGQVGLPQKVVERAQQAPPIDRKLRARITSKRFRISDSFFIPAEAGLDFKKTDRYIPQKRRKPVGGDWQPGDELFVPLRDFPGKIMGYLSVDTPTDGARPDVKTIEALEMLVEAAAACVREVEAREALQRSEKKYRILVETAQEGIGISDPKENLVFVNQAFANLLGYKKEELLGRNLKELCESSQFAIFKAETKKRMQGLSSKYEAKLLTRHGKPKYVYVSAAPLLDEPGNFVGTLGVLSDLTEIKKAREYNILLGTSRSLSRTLKLDQVLKIGTERMAKVLKADRCSFSLFDKSYDSRAIKQVFVKKGSPSSVLPGKRTPSDKHFSQVKEILKREGYLHIKDADTTPFPPSVKNYFRRVGIKSSLIIPLFVDKKLVGVFHIVSIKKLRSFTSEEISLAQTLANQIAVAAKNALLIDDLKEKHSQIEKQAKTLEKKYQEQAILMKTSRELSKTLDLDRIIEIATKEAAQALSVDRCAVALAFPEDGYAEIMSIYVKEGKPVTHRLGYKLYGHHFPQAKEMFERRKLINIPNTQNLPDKSFAKEYFIKEKIKSALFVPMVHGRKLEGFFVLSTMQNLKTFTKEEMKLAQAIADQVAVAIENARLLELVRKNEENLKALSAQLIEVQEDERKKIAQELHDEVGQMLQLMKMNLDRIKKDVTSEPYKFEATREWLLDTEKMLSKTIDDIRTLTFDLRPTMLDDFGLIPTLRWYIDDYTRRSNIKVSLKAKDKSYRFPSHIEVTLYRITQEALTNVAKHAHATETSVTVSQKNSNVILSVRDNGVGFDPKKILSVPRSMGLLNIRERINLLGGSFEIISRPRKGTTLNINIPFSEVKHEEGQTFGR